MKLCLLPFMNTSNPSTLSFGQKRAPIFRGLLGALTVLGLTASAAQASVTTLSFQPSPADLNDLDHHMAYTWKIQNVSLTGFSITSATLSITNISNWDTNPNLLHLHLLDTAKASGIGSFIDDPTGSTPVTDLTDDFVSTRYHNDPNWLVANGTADTFLANPSFTTTGVNYTLNFTPSQLSALASVERHGPVTLGRLAELEWVAPPTITKVVAKLEAEGLLARRVDGHDRRIARVSTTPAALALLVETRRRKDAWLAARIAGLGSDERERLAAALDVLEWLTAEAPR